MTEITIPFLPIASVGLVFFVLWRMNNLKAKNDPQQWKREVLVSVFFFYGLAIAYFTLFKGGVIIFAFGMDKVWNTEVLTDSFRMLRGNERAVYLALFNIVGNILLFIPLGVLLPLLWAKGNSVLKVCFCGMILSFGIESIQLYTAGNISDIDDVLFNTSGALIGISLFRLTQWFSRLYSKRCSQQKRCG